MSFDYYSAMDRTYGSIEPADTTAPEGDFTSLGPKEIGQSTNPMMHQVAAFAARIRQGASKIEIGFMGAGKSNSQQPSPEAFGRLERQDIRELAKMNDISTSVHAPLHGQSLAGLGEQGFSAQARNKVLEEIERAIQFSAEATRGGAIVFHTGEWQRPVSEVQDKTGAKFSGYEEEDKRAPKFVVDSRTGEIMGVRKDHYVYEPKFHTAETYEKELGKKLVGTLDSKTGLRIEKDDWVDIDGHPIKRSWILDESKAEALFERIPIWDKDKTNFKVEQVSYNDFVNDAERLSKELGKEVKPEVLFYKSRLANQVLQAKGSSLFHAQRYEDFKEQRDAARQALEFYEKLENNIPEDEKWKILISRRLIPDDVADKLPPKNMLPSEYLKDLIKSATDQMRHIHESSAHADTQARQALDQMNRLQAIDDYGLDKTSWTIGQAGIKAMQYSDMHQKELAEKIYVAPENFMTEMYGSHPDEIRKIVEESRKQMAQELEKKYGYNAEEAKKRAKEHIKATVDIGHMNMWRKHMVVREGESPEQREKRFEKWILDETEKLAKDGIIGHIHLTDNMGFNDEHLTPGQGNAPIKEFIKRMEKAGLKDFIAEQSGFNDSTILADTWSMMGSPVYATRGVPSFRTMHHQHMGYHNPSTYIVGAYAPSNEWTLWSGVPFE